MSYINIYIYVYYITPYIIYNIIYIYVYRRPGEVGGLQERDVALLPVRESLGAAGGEEFRSLLGCFWSSDALET